MEAIARCEWMSERGVAWKGYDLDAFNRTLSTTYPESVVFVEPGPEREGELIKIFRDLAQSEVTLIDPSAHMNRTILRAMEMVRLTQLCEAIAARVTVLVYPVDEVSDMDDIAQTVEALGDSVDWIIVRNPVKIPTTKFFQGSDLESQLLGFGAARLEIPALLSDTRNHLRSLEIQLGRGVSPAEALKNPRIQLDMAHRIVLEQWLAEFFERLDAIARHLIPTAKAKALRPAKVQEVFGAKAPNFWGQSGEHPMSTKGEEDWRYWKAAISCLPTQETRDAAWEFFVRHFSQNPKMADTLSGLILVMQANGLYMLEAPKMVRQQIVDPLNEALTHFGTDLDRAIDRHNDIANEASQSTEIAVTAIKGLEEAIRSGWQEVNAAKLAERVHAELEATLLQPLAIQCRLLEQAASAVNEALEHMERSTRQLRGFYFKSVLAAMLIGCIVITGDLFGFGWWKLSRHYELKMNATLERILSVNATNQETFTQLKR